MTTQQLSRVDAIHAKRQIIVSQGHVGKGGKVVDLIPLPATDENVSPAVACFLAYCDAIRLEVPFSSKWSNGTGYFNHAVTDAELKLAPGQMCKFKDSADRRDIILASNKGRIVLFERYADTPRTPVVSNASWDFEEALKAYDSDDFTTSGPTSLAQIEWMMGNTGKFLSDVNTHPVKPIRVR